MTIDNDIEELFDRYLVNKCQGKELSLLQHHFRSRENEQVLRQLIREELESNDDLSEEISTVSVAVLSNTFKLIKEKMKR